MYALRAIHAEMRMATDENRTLCAVAGSALKSVDVALSTSSG